MRTLRRMAASTLLASVGALAAPNDFDINRLAGLQDRDLHFQAFAKEVGAALSSMDLMPPDTLGHSGFAVAAELTFVALKTRQPSAAANFSSTDPTFVMPTEAGTLGPSLLPSIHVRKGLPWSFEVGARVGWVDRSDMTVATMEAKWAGNEGFAYLPDVAARIYATRLFNTRNFDLGVGGLDVSVGKQFAVGGMVTFTPYVGWNLAFVGASSNELIDLNPGRTEDQAYAPLAPPPVLNNTQQIQNIGQFKNVIAWENAQNRFYFGLRFIGGVIQIIGELSATGLGSLNFTGGTQTLPAVLSINTAIGLDF